MEFSDRVVMVKKNPIEKYLKFEKLELLKKSKISIFFFKKKYCLGPGMILIFKGKSSAFGQNLGFGAKTLEPSPLVKKIFGEKGGFDQNLP